MSTLFPENIVLPQDGEVYLIPGFIPAEDCNVVLESLKNEIAWKQEHLQMYGKQILFPRLNAWYANEGKVYKYSGIVNIPTPWTDLLLELKQGVEDACEHIFNSALLNYYRNGQDSMGWHSDDEAELGVNPVIASLSFGASREFQFKHKKNPTLKRSMVLNNGSLLIMRGSTQHHWLHQIPKQKSTSGERINITFRSIM